MFEEICGIGSNCKSRKNIGIKGSDRHRNDNNPTKETIILHCSSFYTTDSTISTKYHNFDQISKFRQNFTILIQVHNVTIFSCPSSSIPTFISQSVSQSDSTSDTILNCDITSFQPCSFFWTVPLLPTSRFLTVTFLP